MIIFFWSVMFLFVSGSSATVLSESDFNVAPYYAPVHDADAGYDYPSCKGSVYIAAYYFLPSTNPLPATPSKPTNKAKINKAKSNN